MAFCRVSAIKTIISAEFVTKLQANIAAIDVMRENEPHELWQINCRHISLIYITGVAVKNEGITGHLLESTWSQACVLRSFPNKHQRRYPRNQPLVWLYSNSVEEGAWRKRSGGGRGDGEWTYEWKRMWIREHQGGHGITASVNNDIKRNRTRNSSITNAPHNSTPQLNNKQNVISGRRSRWPIQPDLLFVFHVTEEQCDQLNEQEWLNISGKWVTLRSIVGWSSIQK